MYLSSFKLSLLILLFAFSSCSQLKAQNKVDILIEKYIEAIGGRAKIKAIQNLVFSGGTYKEGDYQSAGNSMMSMARPYYKLVGNKNEPDGYLEGYDGSAWEYFEDPGVVIRTVGPPSEAIRHYAGVERPLVDYKEKGSTAEIIGETKLGEHQVTVIKLTRRDGYVEQIYIDNTSWLVVASGGEAPIHAFGDDVASITSISDYRPVAGVLTAHRFESVRIPSGEALSSMQWSKIEANVDLPEDWFSPPSFKRTLYQAFIEHLYGQRSDIQSIWWTYFEFKRANPEINTSDAANIAGYQMLKMGNVENAIALLEQNIKDYPKAANARFGLGRAYQTAKRFQEARQQYEAALKVDPDHKRAKRALEALQEK